jgi:hypothetical protein
MIYETWKNEVFGMNENSCPIESEMIDEAYSLNENLILDYIDKSLTDSSIHNLYSPKQIGIGLNIIYSNCCSDYSFSYLNFSDEERIISSIKKLKFLYQNFFEKYCNSPVNEIGDSTDNRLDYICYMFWDLFVLYPKSENITKKIIEASVQVMSQQLLSKNDNVVVSALHGLGHWASDCPEIKNIIDKWLKNPTTSNKVIHDYAKVAKTGCIQ